MELLQQGLSAQKPKAIKMGDEEEHDMVDFDKSQINSNKKRRKNEAYDEDDEDEYMGQGRQVRCANQ